MSIDLELGKLLNAAYSHRKAGVAWMAADAARAARELLRSAAVEDERLDGVIGEQAEVEGNLDARVGLLRELVARVEARSANPAARADALLTAAIAMQRRERHEATIALSRRSAEISKDVGACDELALGRWALSLVACGRFEEAVNAGRQHVAAARVGGSKGSEVVALTNLAEAYAGTTSYHEAVECLDNVIAIFGVHSPSHRALGPIQARRVELVRLCEGAHEVK